MGEKRHSSLSRGDPLEAKAFNALGLLVLRGICKRILEWALRYAADVIACNMAHVSLDDASLDVAVFSLSLMGSNFTDYLREAHRTLKLDGHLHIIEATSRFKDRARFLAGLKALRFAVLDVRDIWQFTHIHALKTEYQPHEDVHLTF